MTAALPPVAASWWAVALFTLAGAGVGALVARHLAGGGYRYLYERDAPRPGFRWSVVLVTAASWGTLTWRFGDAAGWSLLPAYLYLGAVGAALIAIDVDVHRLPDLMVLPSLPIALVLLLIPTWVTGHWSSLGRALVAAVVLGAGYLLLLLVSPGGGGLGLGDVKLAALLGLLLGWAGWGPVLVSVFAAFVLGGLGSLVLLALRRVSLKGHIAFGPAMIVGAWAALFFPVQLVLT